MPAALRFARHAVALRWSDLPAATIDRAKTFLLDSLGVGLAGATAPGAAAIRAAAVGWAGQGSTGGPIGTEAAIWGTAARLPAPSAALVNGFQLHCQEYDCLHEAAVLHPMATLLPAALAYAERAGGVTGRDFLLALVAGVDVAVSLGLAATAGLRFFRPATAGGFGACAAVGRLAGFDAPTLAGAFGLLYAQTSGTMQPHVEGSLALPLQPGFNARAALEACDLAAAGIAGPLGAIDGPYGYLTLFEGSWDLAPIWPALGQRFRIAELSHKPYPAGRATHGGIEGVARLQAAHGFTADQIAGVTVRAPPLIRRLVGRPALPNPSPSYARLCMGYAIARQVLAGGVDPTDFRPPVLTDPATYALAARVVTEDDGGTDPNALVPQQISVTLTDGRRYATDIARMRAHPDRPLSHEEHLAKFRRCCALAETPIDPAPLIAAVDRLETLADLRALAALLRAAA